MRITLRKLEELCAHLQKEERILIDRVKPCTIMSLHRRGLCHFLIKRGRILGFGALWPTSDDSWYELGTLWVHPRLRGLHISGSIFGKLVKKIPKSSKVFLITKSRKVAHEARKHGWLEDKGWLKSDLWQILCSPVGEVDAKAARKFSRDSQLFFSLQSHH